MVMWLGLTRGTDLAYPGEEKVKKESNCCIRVNNTGL